MKVVILCGGYGTRIRDVADDIPKPMIPIGDLPILWHIMKYYAGFGYKDFILCLGYKSKVIKDFFLNYKSHTSDFTLSLGDTNSIQFHNNNEEYDWKITFAETGANTMTGARLKRVQKYLLDEEDFMLTYGDGVGNIGIDKLVDYHRKNKKVLTVTGVKPPGRFGELVHDKTGKVLEFNEKPQATAGQISAGYFVCNKKIFDYLSDDDNLLFEAAPMNNLVHDGELMVYSHEGFWHPMDTSRDYLLLNKMYKENKSPWKIW